MPSVISNLCKYLKMITLFWRWGGGSIPCIDIKRAQVPPTKEVDEDHYHCGGGTHPQGL